MIRFLPVEDEQWAVLSNVTRAAVTRGSPTDGFEVLTEPHVLFTYRGFQLRLNAIDLEEAVGLASGIIAVPGAFSPGSGIVTFNTANGEAVSAILDRLPAGSETPFLTGDPYRLDSVRLTRNPSGREFQIDLSVAFFRDTVSHYWINDGGTLENVGFTGTPAPGWAATPLPTPSIRRSAPRASMPQRKPRRTSLAAVPSRTPDGPS